MDDVPGVLAIFFLILINAFFVAGEFALMAVDRDQVERLAADGSGPAQGTLKALATLSFQLSGAQLGITVSSLAVGIIAEPVFASVLAPLFRLFGAEPESYVALSAAIGLGIATTAQMVIGELIPKNYAIARSLSTALVVGNLMRWVNIAMTPATKLFNGAANAALRVLGIEPRDELRRDRSREEIELLIRSSAEGGVFDDEEITLISKAFDFADKTVADALIPRTAISALPQEARISDLVRSAVDTGHSRFPVYGTDLDDIRGIAHVKDVYQIPADDRRDSSVSQIVQPAYAIPETLPLSSVLVDMRMRGSQMAAVIDEYGGTAGIITLEDVLEEIVGEIDDEFDIGEVRAPHPTAADAGVWEVDGMLHRDELVDVCDFVLPEGEWETLAGFLLYVFERIPRTGAKIVSQGWTFEVLEMRRRRIARVRIHAPEEEMFAGDDTEPSS